MILFAFNRYSANSLQNSYAKALCITLLASVKIYFIVLILLWKSPRHWLGYGSLVIGLLVLVNGMVDYYLDLKVNPISIVPAWLGFPSNPKPTIEITGFNFSITPVWLLFERYMDKFWGVQAATSICLKHVFTQTQSPSAFGLAKFYLLIQKGSRIGQPSFCSRFRFLPQTGVTIASCCCPLHSLFSKRTTRGSAWLFLQQSSLATWFYTQWLEALISNCLSTRAT